MAGVIDRLKHGWNAFKDRTDENVLRTWDYGATYGQRPDRSRRGIANERSIISSIYTRIGIDIAAIQIRHVKLDNNNHYLKDVDSALNRCLTRSANLDQGARAFRQDLAISLFENGVAVVVPVDTSMSPDRTSGYDINSLRVGEVVSWYPRHVRVRLYNEDTGTKEELVLPKSFVAIIENPLYSVMNEPNSTLQRLIRKLNLLDAVDEQSSSGKLDIIIQLPYTIRTQTRRDEAEKRRKSIENQLKDSRYGIAYADATERITQLNRPSENNLLKQVEYLTAMLYGQLGLTPGVFTGEADEKAMLNYYNRTVNPILDAIVEELARKFLTKTAITQRHSIAYFRNAFNLVSVSDLAEIADKFTRNEILSSNEVRGIIGYSPSSDPRADQLINKNIPDKTLEGEVQNGT